MTGYKVEYYTREDCLAEWGELKTELVTGKWLATAMSSRYILIQQATLVRMEQYQENHPERSEP